MVSEVQVKILTKLMKSSDGLRYSQAYPGKDIDDDLYNYHLQQLVEKGLVEKKDSKYQLTIDGRREVQKIDAKGQVMDYYFRISVLLYVINEKGELLLQKRTRYPLLGDINTPSGKVKQGESFTDAAKRKLLEETGLMADFQFIGAFRSTRYDENGNFEEDTIYHVCIAENFRGNLIEKTEFGEYFWGTFQYYLELQKTNKSGSRIQEEVIRRVKDRNREAFYFEEVLKIKGY